VLHLARHCARAFVTFAPKAIIATGRMGGIINTIGLLDTIVNTALSVLNRTTALKVIGRVSRERGYLLQVDMGG
jgi:hypothetical protein